jgi:hypothetical protein
MGKRAKKGQDSDDSIGSDFGECVAEYDVDSDGNPLDAPDFDEEQSTPAGEKGEKKSAEERRKEKKLSKLDKRIKQVTKANEKERKYKITDAKDIKNKHKRMEVALMKKM